VVAVALSGTSWVTAAGRGLQSGLTRTIFAAVTDKQGRPVLDMSAADFEVRDGGKTPQIAARLSAAPLRVALIVSDRGSGFFQGGALRLCEALLGHGEISITQVIVQPQVLVGFSSSPDALREGLQRLGRRGVNGEVGAQLLEAVADAAGTVKRDGARPAIVVMRSGGEAASSVRPDLVKQALIDSGAVLYVARATSAREPGHTFYQGDEGANMNRFQNMGAQSNEGRALIDVLDASSKESGGRQIDVAGPTMVPAMQQIAAELANQYEITYTLPPGTTGSDRLSVSSKRKGVTVYAPSRVARR
jgi:hypothetical protein